MPVGLALFVGDRIKGGDRKNLLCECRLPSNLRAASTRFTQFTFCHGPSFMDVVEASAGLKAEYAVKFEIYSESTKQDVYKRAIKCAKDVSGKIMLKSRASA
jgi:hypothetical protein